MQTEFEKEMWSRLANMFGVPASTFEDHKTCIDILVGGERVEFFDIIREYSEMVIKDMDHENALEEHEVNKLLDEQAWRNFKSMWRNFMEAQADREQALKEKS